MSDNSARFALLSSFRPIGFSPEAISIKYRSTSPDFPAPIEQKVNAVWSDLSADNERLFDGPMMSVYDADQRTNHLYTERTSFRYFLTKQGLLQGSISTSEYEFSDEQMSFLAGQLRVLSSFTAVIVDGHILLGVRSSSTDAHQLSFPGSGYLDPSEDVSAAGEVVATSTLVLREIEEEIGLGADVDEIRCMGVFEHIVEDRRSNPALFSVVELPNSRSELEAASETAPDSWEFGRFIYVPLEPESIERLLSFIPTVPAERFGLDRPAELSPKACLMLLLVGARNFGNSWFERVHRDINLEVVDS